MRSVELASHAELLPIFAGTGVTGGAGAGALAGSDTGMGTGTGTGTGMGTNTGTGMGSHTGTGTTGSSAVGGATANRVVRSSLCLLSQGPFRSGCTCEDRCCIFSHTQPLFTFREERLCSLVKWECYL